MCVYIYTYIYTYIYIYIYICILTKRKFALKLNKPLITSKAYQIIITNIFIKHLIKLYNFKTKLIVNNPN